jgi:hypothetical protein
LLRVHSSRVPHSIQREGLQVCNLAP